MLGFLFVRSVPNNRMAHSQHTIHSELIKLLSFEIHNATDEIIRGMEDGKCVPVSVQSLRKWRSNAKKINVSITRAVRCATDISVRHLTEMNLLREAMRADIVDREASISQTLSVLKTAETDSMFVGVDRALRAVSKQTSLLGAISEQSDDADFANIRFCDPQAELKAGEMLLISDGSVEHLTSPTSQPSQPTNLFLVARAEPDTLSNLPPLAACKPPPKPPQFEPQSETPLKSAGTGKSSGKSNGGRHHQQSDDDDDDDDE